MIKSESADRAKGSAFTGNVGSHELPLDVQVESLRKQVMQLRQQLLDLELSLAGKYVQQIGDGTLLLPVPGRFSVNVGSSSFSLDAMGVQMDAHRRLSLNSGDVSLVLGQFDEYSIPMEEQFRVSLGSSSLYLDGNGVSMKNGMSHVKIDTLGISLQSCDWIVARGGYFQMEASGSLRFTCGGSAYLQCSELTVYAPKAAFSTLVGCDTLKANTVVAATYTPGAGNIW